MAKPLVVIACLLVACERPASTSTPAPTPSPTPTPSPDPAPPPAPTPDPTPVDAGPSLYPEAKILAGQAEVSRSCGGMVYKQGCRVLRRGAIELGVTIDEAGTQTKVEVLLNTVDTDPKLVLDCAQKALAKHRFEPHPGGATFTVKLRLGDKC